MAYAGDFEVLYERELHREYDHYCLALNPRETGTATPTPGLTRPWKFQAAYRSITYCISLFRTKRTCTLYWALVENRVGALFSDNRDPI